MESILEVLVGLYYVIADNAEEEKEYDTEFQIIYSAIAGTETEDIFRHAVCWINYESGEITKEVYKLMTDSTYGM